jgi:hypothetical protein
MHATFQLPLVCGWMRVHTSMRTRQVSEKIIVLDEENRKLKVSERIVEGLIWDLVDGWCD